MKIGIGTDIVIAMRNPAETGGMVGGQTVVERTRGKDHIGENAVGRGGAKSVADPGTGGTGLTERGRRHPGDLDHRRAARMFCVSGFLKRIPVKYPLTL